MQLALSIKPNFSQSLNNLGVVYTVQVKYFTILNFGSCQISTVSDNLFFLLQGKVDAAASMIEKAIIANPTYAEAYNNLGLIIFSVVIICLVFVVPLHLVVIVLVKVVQIYE